MRKIVVVLLVAFFMTSDAIGQDTYIIKRNQMVKTQIKARGVENLATLNAMSSVPRHQFVPEAIKTYAYEDRPLPIGNGQTISQPYIVAYMTEVLQLRTGHRVLEIGTGSGYQAAVLAKIVDTVYTIEIVEDLAIEASKRLRRLGYGNVKVRSGDGYHGWPQKAPFDAIMVTAGAESIPQALVDQLKVDGRMIIPVGPHHGIRQLVLIIKKKKKIIKKNMMAVRFVPFTRNIE